MNLFVHVITVLPREGTGRGVIFCMGVVATETRVENADNTNAATTSLSTPLGCYATRRELSLIAWSPQSQLANNVARARRLMLRACYVVVVMISIFQAAPPDVNFCDIIVSYVNDDPFTPFHGSMNHQSLCSRTCAE